MKDRLVSSRCLREQLEQLQGQAKEHAPFLPEYARNRDEWLLAEFGRIIREAETEYVGTGDAEEVTGWDSQTLRRYARAAVEGTALPLQWQGLVAVRDGRDYALLLSSIPVHPSRRALAS
jgi:hypothetical protein